MLDPPPPPESGTQRFAGRGLDLHVVARPKCQASNAVSLGFELPAGILWQFADQLGFHRRKGERNTEVRQSGLSLPSCNRHRFAATSLRIAASSGRSASQ